MRIIYAILILFLISSAIVLAHGTRFFEFAPDISKSFRPGGLQIPAQPFYPPNDFLGGVDVWIENTGAAGDVTFGLRDENDILLISKTVTIPYTPAVFGGTRFHIDFDNQIPVYYDKIYKLRILTSQLPSLKLYEANQNQILEHNTQNNPYYKVEPAIVDSTAQNFTFKYALFETRENMPPVVSNVTATILSSNQVQIDFTANELVDFKVDFGPQNQGNTGGTVFSGTYIFCLPDESKPCRLTIDVMPSTSYHFDLLVKDEWDNQTSIPGNFTTPAGPVTPTPSSLTSPGVSPTPTPQASPSNSPTPSSTPKVSSSPTPSPSGSPQNSPQPSSPSGTSFPSPTNSPGGGKNPSPSEPPLTVSVGGSSEGGSQKNSQNIVITWNPPPGLNAANYRIDVFDVLTKKLVKQILVSGVTRKLVLEKLAPGRYRIIIYAVKDGELTQIGEPQEIDINLTQPQNPFLVKNLVFVSLIIFSGLLVLAAILRYTRARKNPKEPEIRSRSIFDKIDK